MESTFFSAKNFLRHQDIRRPELEKLPWTGHLCYLFTRVWEIGRQKSQLKKSAKYRDLRDLSNNLRANGCDWMRGQDEPLNEETRHEIPKNSWHEKWLNYERDLEIQEDQDWLSEAVFHSYQKHLDKMIRANDLLWMDFCRKRYVWNEEKGDWDTFLELSTRGYDTTDPTVVVPSTYKTVIPEPELHFSFSTTLMVMAIELYQQEAERSFCHYVTYAHRKLVQFVESRKQMTAESYRFFIEHAYNQFLQHESFHVSARSKTKAKDIGASGELHTSTRLSGYLAWKWDQSCPCSRRNSW